MLKVSLNMKVVLLIFFSFTLPFVIFLASLQFGGITKTDIKTSLAHSSIYSETSTYVTKAFTSESADATEQQFGEIIKNRFTPDYLQSKTENTIDQTSAWITGKSQIPPKISFKELKDDITTQNPELLPAIAEAAKQAQQNANDQKSDDPQTEQLASTVATFNTMVASDFTFDITSYVQGLKVFYNAMFIWLIVLAVLMLASLFGIVKFAENASSRSKWLGATFLTSGILGYGTVFLSSLILSFGTQLVLNSTNTYLNLVRPFVLAIGGQVMQHYMTLQAEISIGMFVLAAVMFVMGIVTKPKTPESTTKGKKKKKI